MPQLTFPQQSVSVPQGVPQQRQTFQGFQDLAGGLLNLGKQQQIAQNATDTRIRKQNAYTQYLSTADRMARGLSEINKLATADEREKAGNEFIQREIEGGLEQATQGGYADEWVKHAVPYFISKQDKFLTDNDAGRIAESTAMLEVEADHMVDQVTNEGVGFQIIGGDTDPSDPFKKTPSQLIFNDDTHEVMGVHLHNYLDLVASHPELGRDAQTKLMREATQKSAESVMLKAVTADPEGFLDHDPRQSFIVPMPLFDLDGGFRSVDIRIPEPKLRELRGMAYQELSSRHSQQTYKDAQADKARDLKGDQIENAVQFAINDGHGPEFIDDLINARHAILDPGKEADLRRTTRDYFNARAGSPHEPLPPHIQGVINTLQLGGVTGDKALKLRDIQIQASMEKWTQHQRTEVETEYYRQVAQARDVSKEQIAEQLDLMKKRFTSIVSNQQFSKFSSDTPTNSLDRLAVEVQQAMSTAFHRLPLEQRTYENILKISYEAQFQAIGTVFSQDLEKLSPGDRKAFANLIQSQLPQGKPQGMTTRNWVLQNTLDEKVGRDEAFPLLFMTEMYDLNAPPGERQALDNQRAKPQLFEAYPRIKRMQDSGNELLIQIEKEMQDLMGRREALIKEQERLQKETDAKLKDLAKPKKKGAK